MSAWIFFTPQWESWRLKGWSHPAAAGTALAELRQCFRYERQRCCYQGRSYEAASVWYVRNSHCVGWPPPLPSSKSSTVLGQEAFVFSDCLVSMVTAQTAHWNKQSSVWSGLSGLTFWKCKTKTRKELTSISKWWRHEWKLWERKQLGFYNLMLLHSWYCRSAWRGMSVTHLKFKKCSSSTTTVGTWSSCFSYYASCMQLDVISQFKHWGMDIILFFF